MIENEMGNRGSKSENSLQLLQPNLNENSVKEQRVDSSYFGGKIPKLRCTLMDCENSYQIKIPSKQIKIFSSKAYFESTSNTTSLDPYFLTGFSDAEGSFLELILKKPNNTVRWTVKSRFSIGLHKKDTES
jgi:hypothetical protein